MKYVIFFMLVLMSLVSVVSAKTELPLTIVCTPGSAQSRIAVRFKRPAQNVTITIKGSGSVEMQTLTSRQSQVNANGEIVVDAIYKVASPSKAGNLSVHVQADFGVGPQFQATGFQIVKGQETNNAKVVPAATGSLNKGGDSQLIILVPSVTTTK